MLNGVQLAIDQANAKGDLGFKLKLVKSDDVGDESKAPAAAAQVLQDSSVIGVVGPAFSGPTKATAKTYGDANMGLISPSATNPDLTKQGFTAFHRVVPADNVEGVQAADWLAKKAKKVFVIDDLSEYGKGAADIVRAQLKADKVTVVSAAQERQERQLRPAGHAGGPLGCAGDVLRRVRRPGGQAGQGPEGRQATRASRWAATA